MLKVIVLDDHPMIIDGVSSRLARTNTLRVVGYANYGQDFRALLEIHQPDVVILDINVRVSPSNDNLFAIFHELDYVQENYPQAVILVISMYNERAMLYSLFEHGASGYLLKDDVEGWNRLDDIILKLNEQMYISPACQEKLRQTKTGELNPLTPIHTTLLSLMAAYPKATTLQIACWLNKSHSTVRNQLSLAYAKLGVTNRFEAIEKARKLGILLDPVNNPFEQLFDLSKLPDSHLFELCEMGNQKACKILHERGLL